MSIHAVIFDWGGTLTPWLTIDAPRIWAEVGRSVDPDRAEELGDRLTAADRDLWRRSKEEYRAFTLAELFEIADVPLTEAALETVHEQWVHATYTDPQVHGLLAELRRRGVRVGILSNTAWPREWHDAWLRRDGVLDSFDAAVYTSDLPWNKPHPLAFQAAMDALEATDPARCVYVGDRLFEDVWGAKEIGMRAVHVPHSQIPPEQVGHSLGVPDATIQELAELTRVLDDWSR